MRVRFVKTVAAAVEKPRLQEIWDKTYNRWDEILVEEVFVSGNQATLKTFEGDFILVPSDSFVKLTQQEKRVNL